MDLRRTNQAFFPGEKTGQLIETKHRRRVENNSPKAKGRSRNRSLKNLAVEELTEEFVGGWTIHRDRMADPWRFGTEENMGVNSPRASHFFPSIFPPSQVSGLRG